jgi:hypothetical protein
LLERWEYDLGGFLCDQNRVKAYLGIDDDDDDDDSVFLILQECDLEEPDGKMFSKCKVGVRTGSLMVQNAFCPFSIT